MNIQYPVQSNQSAIVIFGYRFVEERKFSVTVILKAEKYLQMAGLIHRRTGKRQWCMFGQ